MNTNKERYLNIFEAVKGIPNFEVNQNLTKGIEGDEPLSVCIFNKNENIYVVFRKFYYKKISGIEIGYMENYKNNEIKTLYDTGCSWDKKASLIKSDLIRFIDKHKDLVKETYNTKKNEYLEEKQRQEDHHRKIELLTRICIPDFKLTKEYTRKMGFIMGAKERTQLFINDSHSDLTVEKYSSSNNYTLKLDGIDYDTLYKIMLSIESIMKEVKIEKEKLYFEKLKQSDGLGLTSRFVKRVIERNKRILSIK